MGGGDVGFVKFSFVTADRAIPSKGLCTHTTLVKRVFNYCHPYVEGCKYIGNSKIIALHPYPALEDYKILFQYSQTSIR